MIIASSDLFPSAPELAGLVDLVREALGTQPRSGMPGAPPLPLLQHHRLGPLLAARGLLSKSVTAVVRRGNPPLQSLQRVAVLLQLTADLEARGIPWLTVKGPVLAQQLWHDPTVRHAGDIDLLIPSAHLPAATRLLRDSGYARIRPWFELSPRQEIEIQKILYEFEYLRADQTGPRVELKWRLESVDPATTPWDAPHLVTLGGRNLHTLPPAANFRYLCHHGSHHAWYRMHWIVDIAALMQGDDVPWGEVLPGGRRHPSYRCVALAARLAQQLCGVAIPAGLLPPGVEDDPVVRSLLEQARRAMLTAGSPLRNLRDWCSVIRYRLQLESGLRGWWRVLRPFVHSPRNWWTLPLPDRWFWLYPWLSPFLWVYRKLRPRKESPF